MAGEHSFNVSRAVGCGEFRNALEQAKKESESRYDLKDVKSELEFSEKESAFRPLYSSEAKLEVSKDIVISKLIKRGINPKGIEELSRGSGAVFKLSLKVNNAIDSESAKQVNKVTKDSKFEVNSQIRGEGVRVSAEQTDDLQAVMKFIKKLGLEFNLSFKNLK